MNLCANQSPKTEENPMVTVDVIKMKLSLEEQ